MRRLAGRSLIAAAAMMALAASARAEEATEIELEDAGELEEYVVTATRTETPAAELGSSVTVITGADIELGGQMTVAEALADVPAVDVVRTGSFGSDTSVFIRGANPEHTLVLLDGIELNDPIGMGREANLRHMTLDNVERIEVVRGAQSTLYGSDALGGVINIITRKGSGEPGGTFSLEGGSFGTFREAVTASGGSENLNYSVGVSRIDSEGISSASEAFGNTEKDGYANTTFYGSFGFALPENGEMSILLRYVDAETEIDDGSGAGGDDPDRVNFARQIIAGTRFRLGDADSSWKQSFGFALTDLHRDDVDPAEATSFFDGRLLKGDWQGTLAVNDVNRLAFGVEHEVERGESSAQGVSDAGTTGVFVQDQLTLSEGLHVTLGARTDVHSRFGAHTTCRAAVAWSPAGSDTRLFATAGTGFKAPSLFQLSYNPDLDPEELTAFDMGIEQRALNDALTVGVTLFRNDFTSLIKWDDAAFNYYNIGKAEGEGAEVSASFQTGNGLSLKAAYTFTDATEDGSPAIRRPTDKARLHASYSVRGGGNVGLSVQYVGATDDSDFSTWPATPVVLPSYTLVGLAASWQVTDKLKVFGRVDNLFDEVYTVAYGYGTPGRSVYVGMKTSF